jgi:membrane fusion protein, multidrug efflux system
VEVPFLRALSVMRVAYILSAVAITLILSLPGHAETPRPVRAQMVEMTPSEVSLTYSGTIQPRVLADLGFRVAGKVIDRPVNVGDFVKAGQVIAKLDPTDLSLTHQADEQAVAAARASAVNTRAEFERYGKMGQKSAAFLPSEFDKRQAAMLSAEAKLAQAERQLALARDQLSYTTLRADADGLITALPAQVGQVMTAGQTVASIAYAAETEVLVDVPENRLGEVRAAKDITVTLWSSPGEMLRGRLREIGALADPASRTFAVRITLLDRPHNLALGMTAAVRFTHPAGAPVAVLPATAIADQGGHTAVWVLDPRRERAALRPVQVAAYRADGTVAVVSGLASGDKVVTAGKLQLDPDMPVMAWSGPTR